MDRDERPSWRGVVEQHGPVLALMSAQLAEVVRMALAPSPLAHVASVVLSWGTIVGLVGFTVRVEGWRSKVLTGLLLCQYMVAYSVISLMNLAPGLPDDVTHVAAYAAYAWPVVIPFMLAGARPQAVLAAGCLAVAFGTQLAETIRFSRAAEGLGYEGLQRLLDAPPSTTTWGLAIVAAIAGMVGWGLTASFVGPTRPGDRRHALAVWVAVVVTSWMAYLPPFEHTMWGVGPIIVGVAWVNRRLLPARHLGWSLAVVGVVGASLVPQLATSGPRLKAVAAASVWSWVVSMVSMSTGTGPDTARRAVGYWMLGAAGMSGVSLLFRWGPYNEWLMVLASLVGCGVGVATTLAVSEWNAQPDDPSKR